MASRPHFSWIALVMLVVGACGGKQSGASRASTVPRYSDACAALTAPEGDRCRAGDGAACSAAGKRISNEVVLDEEQRDQHAACMLVAFERGCAFRDSYACVRRAVYGQERGDEEPYRARACDLEVGHCAEWARLYAPAPAGRAPNPQMFERAAQKACDLGNVDACFDLAHAYLPRGQLALNPQRALKAWEWGCLANNELNTRCDDLRKFLLQPDSPKRDRYDRLPTLALEGERGASDKTPPNDEYVRLVAEIDLACAAGDAGVCLRRTEIEWMRWTHSAVLDQRNIGTPARFDINAELERLCASGVGEACHERSFRGILLQAAPAKQERERLRLRGCEAGSPRACVRVAHELRAHDVSGAQRARVAELFASGCRAGLRWACEEPDRL